MSLFDAKETLKTEAAKLPMKYEKYDITVLADGYCDALDCNDKENQGIYLSALMLRFWYKIDSMYNKCKAIGFEREDAYEKLMEIIQVACKYRAWRDPDKHTNAQACIMQTIASRGAAAVLGEFKYQKNNHLSVSLDDPISPDGDATFGNTVEDESVEVFDSAKSIIQSLINNNHIVEAIIADTIAYRSDTFKYSKKVIKEEYRYTDYSAEFWPFKLVKALNSLDAKYIDIFSSTYTVNPVLANAALADIIKASNQKKYKIIDKSLSTLKSYI